MARYIDAEKLVEKIKRCSAFKNMKSFWYESELLQNVVLDLIDNLPTAYVEDVVRCKHCKYYKASQCHRFSGKIIITPYFYCAYGERRTDNDL